MEEGSVHDRIFLLVLFFLGLIILAKRKFSWSNAIKNNIWLMVLLGYMFVSIIWSDMQFVSLKRCVRELVAIVMAFMVATESKPLEALQSLFRRMIYVLIPFSYILIHYFPEYGRQYASWSGALMWTGVATQKNSLSLLCLISVFFLIWTFARRRQGIDITVIKHQVKVEVFLFALAIWLFMGPRHTLTNSATSAATIAAGLTVLIYLLWLKRRDKLIGAGFLSVIIVIIMAYGTITPFIGELSLLDVSSLLGRDETLTGRSEIWEVLVPYAMKKPIWGYGFGGFWTDAIRDATSSHAHNGYLDIILNMGFFGLLLVAIFFISCCWKSKRVIRQDFYWGAFWICFLIMAVVHNIAESSVVAITSPMARINLFLLVSCTAATSNNQMVSRKV